MDRRTFAKLLALSPLAAAAPSRALAAAAPQVSLRMDYEATEALLAVLQATSITDAEIDRLLKIRGVAATVDNTTKYFPQSTRDVFRAAIKEYVATRKESQGEFGLRWTAKYSGDAVKAMEGLKAEPDLLAQITGPINRYRPDSGPLPVTVYCVICGVSDGFVLDGDPEPAFFMAIDRSQGDVQGIKLNMVHELYHVAQRAARARVPGLAARVFDEKTAPPPVRLLSIVLEEGTANFVADATKMQGSGPYLEMWRSKFVKNAPQEKITANFALFDKTLAGLHDGSLAWDKAYQEGFAGEGPLYFVGYEMAKAIERKHGPARIGPYFQEHPAQFFRDYIALTADKPARFSTASETIIAAMK